MSLQILCLVNSSLPIVAAHSQRSENGKSPGWRSCCRYARSNGAAVCVSASRYKPSMVLYGQLSSAVCRAPGNPWRHLQHPQLCFSSWPAQCRHQGCFTKRRCVRNFWNCDWDNRGDSVSMQPALRSSVLLERKRWQLLFSRKGLCENVGLV